MEIEDRFDSLEDILTAAAKESLTFRIGCEPDDADDFDGDDAVVSDFAAERSESEIASLEKELADISPAEEKEDKVSPPESDRGDADGNSGIGEEIKKARIVFIDLFLKKIYKQTLIVEKETDEAGKTYYEIVAVCETPMC